MAVVRDCKLVSKILYMHQIDGGSIACDMQEFFADEDGVVLQHLQMRTIIIPPELVAKHGMALADDSKSIWANTKTALYTALLEMGAVNGVEG